MVTIRLARGGAKKSPFYHIVAANSRNARDGRNLERLGYFNPVARGADKRLELNLERVEYWISKGAQASQRVKSLIQEAQNPEAFNAKKEAKAAKVAEKKAQAKAAKEAEAKAESEASEAAASGE